MKDQDPLWNACRASQSSFSGQSILGISLGDEGVLYTDATDLRALGRGRGKQLCHIVGLAQKMFLEERRQFLNNGAITVRSAY